MTDTISLAVPESDQTRETITHYYEFYLTEMQRRIDGGNANNQLTAETVEDLIECRQAIRRVEQDGRFRIYYQIVSSVAEKLDPGPYELWKWYSDEEAVDGTIRNPIGLARFERACERARTLITDNEEHVQLRLNQLIVLTTFAIENSYGLRYTP